MKTRIGIISLNSGGTMGHMSLTTSLSKSLCSKDFEVFLLSDHDYSKYIDYSKYNFKFLNLKKTKHNFSKGGNIDYQNKKEIINLVKSHNITKIFFSTFFDLELLKYFSKNRIDAYLISYPLRDTHRRIFQVRKYFKYFKKIFTLEDIYLLRNKSPNEMFVSPDIKDVKKVIKDVKKINSILFTCGGGSRSSSKIFWSLAKKTISMIKKNYPDIKISIIKGNSNVVIKGVKTIKWSKSFNKLLSDTDLIISEAGYYTLLDLIELRKSAILIPGFRRIDNQELRAIEFESKGFGYCVLPEQNYIELYNKIIECINNPSLIANNKFKNINFDKKDIVSAILNELK